MKLVTFSRHWGGNSGYYNSGETAGFDNVMADTLIAGGVAVLAEEQPEQIAEDESIPMTRAELDVLIPSLTKADLVKLGASRFGLTLDVSKRKDELAASLQAAVEASAVPPTTEANG